MNNFFGLVLLFFSSSIYADSIPDDVFDLTPDNYTCDYDRSGLPDVIRKFEINRKSNEYFVSYLEQLRPGKLHDYLEPLGVDERIIANYISWSIDPVRIPVDACRSETFGSLYAEKLLCSSTGVKLQISASYRNTSGVIKTDRYLIDNAEVRVNTVVESGLKGTGCPRPKNGIEKSLRLSFEAKFKNIMGTQSKVSSVEAFHPSCSEYSDAGQGGWNYLGGCKVKGGIRFDIGLDSLIEMRE
jgi:hypothetical protein